MLSKSGILSAAHGYALMIRRLQQRAQTEQHIQYEPNAQSRALHRVE
jgi:hypothetical protein